MSGNSIETTIMSDATQIVLYDIPSREPRHCWSWNAWKTRFLLNFKGLDYVTEWTEYPDIKPKLEEHFPGETEFTIPTIRIKGSETYVMDSRNIAARLEADHPTPPVHLDSPYIDRLIQNLRLALIPLQPVYGYLVATRILNEESIPFFIAARSRDVGMPLEQFHREGAETAWEKAEKGFSNISELLRENEGPFFMGQTVSYADFVCAGVLLFLKGLGEDVSAELVKVSGDEGRAYNSLLEAVEPWSKRNSY